VLEYVRKISSWKKKNKLVAPQSNHFYSYLQIKAKYINRFPNHMAWKRSSHKHLTLESARMQIKEKKSMNIIMHTASSYE